MRRAVDQTQRHNWEKLLYRRQPFPDNYFPHDKFLSEMRKNAMVKTYRYPEIFLNSLLCVRHLSFVVLFSAFFYYLHVGWVSAQQLILAANSSASFCYIVWVILSIRRRSKAGDNVEAELRWVKQAGKSATLLFLILLGLTPIIKTLTEDTSSDTIWRMSVTSLLINIIFFDYDIPERGRFRGKDTISLNAAVFATVLLASRLPSISHVFGLISLALIWFALGPLVIRAIHQRFPLGGHVVTLALTIGALVTLYTINKPLMIVFLGLLLFITLVCPAWFVHLQKYKNQIHGPWDEATLKLT